MRGMPAGRGEVSRRVPGALTMYDYALVDGAARPDTAEAVRYYTQDPRHQARSLFARQPEAANADAGPWLVSLDGNPGLRNWLHALDMLPGAVARLVAEVSFEPLFDHLESCLDMRLSDGSLALLRYWDGRVFWRIQGVLTPTQRLALLGPIARWSVYVEGQEWALDRSSLENR